VQTGYCGFKIGLDEKAAYELDAEAAYGKITYHDISGSKVSRIQESNKMKVYSRVGAEDNPSATVNIKTKYAHARLAY